VARSAAEAGQLAGRPENGFRPHGNKPVTNPALRARAPRFESGSKQRKIRIMSNKAVQRNPPPTMENDVSVAPAPPSRPRRSKRASSSTLSEPFSQGGSFDRSEPRGFSLMRTRRLLMAALRVWELKNGIRNPY
jgi:hypothetical protein